MNPTPPETVPPDSNASFEAALEKLEHIVSQLESGKLSLEDSLRMFEEGMLLSKKCRAQLDAAEAKIEKIVSASNAHATAPFDVDESDND